MHTITLRENVAGLGTVSRDKLLSKTIVIVMEVAAKLERVKNYKEFRLSPRQ
jgi:hypothetical protein